jgi:hypothetical protein
LLVQIFILRVAGFRKKLVSKLKVAEDKRNWGLFIDSCFTHCQTPFNISWHSPISPRLDDRVRFKPFEQHTAIASVLLFSVSSLGQISSEFHLLFA